MSAPILNYPHVMLANRTNGRAKCYRIRIASVAVCRRLYIMYCG